MQVSAVVIDEAMDALVKDVPSVVLHDVYGEGCRGRLRWLAKRRGPDKDDALRRRFQFSQCCGGQLLPRPPLHERTLPYRKMHQDGGRYAQRQPSGKDPLMHLSLSLAPLVSLLAGVVILLVPRLLNYVVAAYLIVIGILGLIGDIHLR